MSIAESMEKLGEAADTIDNLIGAMSLPMPAHLHIAGLKASLPEVRDALRAVYVAETGDDPWADNPSPTILGQAVKGEGS